MKKKDVKNKIKREQKLNTSKKNYEQLLNRERLKKKGGTRNCWGKKIIHQ